MALSLMAQDAREWLFDFIKDENSIWHEGYKSKSFIRCPKTGLRKKKKDCDCLEKCGGEA